MRFFKVFSVEEVKEIIQEKFYNYPLGTTTISIDNALGRIVAENIYSNENLPPFNRSTVDGYAIKSRDIVGVSESIPGFLEVLGEVTMGEEFKRQIEDGKAVYVPTGGIIPLGADSVVMVEYVEKVDERNIVINKPTASGENIVYAGDDIKENDLVLTQGTYLTPYHIGVLASLGIGSINVYEKLKFSIISTGDEIIEIGEKAEIGKIRDINGYTIAAMVDALGGQVINKTIVNDDLDNIKNNVKSALQNSDVVLISGGSSVGTRDYTVDVINSFPGDGVLVHGVSVKPGKPTILGECSGKPVFGLPGHPASALFLFKILVEFLFKMVTRSETREKSVYAYMTENFHSSPGKDTYQLVKLEDIQGKMYATPLYGKSGYISTFSKADGYIVIDKDTEGLNKDDAVLVKYL